MKKSSLIIMCLACMLLLGTFAAACGQQTAKTGDPQQAVTSMLEAMKTGDATASYNLLSAADKKQIKLDEWKQALGGQESVPKDLTWKVTKTKVDGDKAVVTVKISAEGESQEEPFTVVKEGGVWKVSYLASSGQTK